MGAMSLVLSKGVIFELEFIVRGRAVQSELVETQSVNWSSAHLADFIRSSKKKKKKRRKKNSEEARKLPCKCLSVGGSERHHASMQTYLTHIGTDCDQKLISRPQGPQAVRAMTAGRQLLATMLDQAQQPIRSQQETHCDGEAKTALLDGMRQPWHDLFVCIRNIASRRRRKQKRKSAFDF